MEKIIKELIDSSKTVAIFFHINPDGDAIGSAMAIKNALQKLGKEVTVFSDSLVPSYLEYLNQNQICYKIVKNQYDLGFVLDCPEAKRIGEMEKVLVNCKNTINIDHHMSNEPFTTASIVNSKASSTCELVYHFLKELNIEFDKEICLDLYTGIATDSGCFMFNITENLHSIANELVKAIDNIEDINYVLFREKDLNEVRLYGEAISKLECYFDNKLAITNITLKDFEKTKSNFDATTGLVFMLSGLKNVNIICVMSEDTDGAYKVAFRSKNTDVCALAKLFGGGGHKFAAGCKIYGTRNSVKQKILNKVKEYLCME